MFPDAIFIFLAWVFTFVAALILGLIATIIWGFYFTGLIVFILGLVCGYFVFCKGNPNVL